MRFSLSYPLVGLATALLLLGGCPSDDVGSTGGGSETAGTDATTNDGSGSGSSSASTTTTGDGDGDTGDGDGDTGDGDGDTGGGNECVVTQCAGKVYECGDCIDNDGDGFIDVADANCWGPCDNNEAGFKGNIPGQNQAPCAHMDCYFDQDSGSGNDKCHWSHKCDPSDPNPSGCNYTPNGNIPGTSLTCETAQDSQDPVCAEVCGPLTPNGCDCFGCCDIKKEGVNYTVFLGTGGGSGTCSVDVVDDPTKCAPCLQVQACLNPCESEECELCIGEVELPDGCEEAKCDGGLTSCDPQNNNADCPLGTSCISGCCFPSPQ